MNINTTSLEAITLDLNKDVPRSPREMLPGCDYVVAARTLDKCRAVLIEKNGEYHYDCPLDNVFFDFSNISADAFKEFVATGANDEEVAAWINKTAKERPRVDIVVWSNDLRYKRISEMAPELQLFIEDYVPECIPAEKMHRLRFWFDIYDLEEGRM